MYGEEGGCLVDGETLGRLNVCSLLHAASCNEEECVEKQCHAVKHMFEHLRHCRYPSIGCCLSCNQFRAVLIEHAATCCAHLRPDGAGCPVPECAKIRDLMRAHMDGENKSQRPQGTHMPRHHYPHRSKLEAGEQSMPQRESSTSAGGHVDKWESEEPPTGGGTLVSSGTLVSRGNEAAGPSDEGTAHGGPMVGVGGDVVESENDGATALSPLLKHAPPHDTPPSPALAPSSFEAFLMCDVPYDYLCPVSMNLLTDPVVAADGITYQRECLEQCIDWSLQRGDKSFRSPMTGLSMHAIFLPNVTVRRQVLEFKEERAKKWRAERSLRAEQS